MINKCINMKYRSKKGQAYCYCTHKRSVIDFKECSGCLSKEYKKVAKKALKTQNKAYSILKAKTPIKKVSKKRKVVSDKTYNIVLDRSKDELGVPHCQLCGAVDNLQYHHVLYRSERKDLIDDPDNGLMLCHRDFSINKCHRVVHQNKKKYQPILLQILDRIKKAG